MQFLVGCHFTSFSSQACNDSGADEVSVVARRSVDEPAVSLADHEQVVVAAAEHAEQLAEGQLAVGLLADASVVEHLTG